MVEQNKRPNKLEKLKEKMQEREEMEKYYSYNPFGKGGNGAPMRDEFGNVITLRKALSSNLYKEKVYHHEAANYEKYNNNKIEQQFQQNSIYQNNFSKHNFNQQQDLSGNFNIPNIYSNYFFQQPFQTQNNGISMNNLPMPNYDSNFNLKTNRGNIYGNQISDFNSLANLRNFNNNLSQISINNQKNLIKNNIQNQNLNENFKNQNINFSAAENNINNFETNKQMEVNQIIKPNTSYKTKFYAINNEEQINELESHNLKQQPNNLDPHLKQMSYQNELKMQIEEKKMKKDEQKRREADLDRQDEEKYKQYLQLKKGQEEQMKLKKSNQNNQFNANISNQPQNLPELIPEKENSNINLKNFENIKHQGIHMVKDENYERGEKNQFNLRQYIGLSYENLNRNIKEETNQQILKLKSEVNKQYSEINDIFSKLRLDVTQAAQLKIEAEREFNNLRDEIDRKRVTNLLYEDKLKFVLEKNAPYNNLHIRLDEVNPITMDNHTNIKQHLNLKSTSTMVYNKEDYLKEKQEFTQREERDSFSRMAQRGKNLMSDSEFIPIVQPTKRGKDLFLNVVSNELDNNISNVVNNNDEVNNIPINDYNVSIGTREFNEMYSKLNEISKLNWKMDPNNKYKTLKSNFDNDINTENKLDAILDEESEFIK